MAWLRGFVVLLATIQAGFMEIDGLHALLLGDYITPRTGKFAGQLGPWSYVVESFGIEPRSLLMKLIFVAYGALWLFVTYHFARGHRWGRAALIAAVIGSLWWVGAQTPLALAQLLLLILLPPNRPAEPPPPSPPPQAT